jgi:pimeloyl-ACP methyl ester carboxylesterase
VQLEYVESGSGDETVVLVHGTLSDLRSWRQQIPAFSERYRVIAYSRRHHHGSVDTTSGTPLTVRTVAADLVALIEALVSVPVHVVGSSYGAFGSLMAAVNRPDLVRTLLLGEPPAGAVLTDPAWQQTWQRFIVEQFQPAKALAASDDPARGVQLFIDGVMGEGAFARMSDGARQSLVDNASAFAIEEAPDVPFGKTEASRITMPVLLLRGELSPPMFGAVLDVLRALLPHAEVAQVPNASHGMHAQNADAYNRLVLDFLARH